MQVLPETGPIPPLGVGERGLRRSRAVCQTCPCAANAHKSVSQRSNVAHWNTRRCKYGQLSRIRAWFDVDPDKQRQSEQASSTSSSWTAMRNPTTASRASRRRETAPGSSAIVRRNVDATIYAPKRSFPAPACKNEHAFALGRSQSTGPISITRSAELCSCQFGPTRMSGAPRTETVTEDLSDWSQSLGPDQTAGYGRRGTTTSGSRAAYAITRKISLKVTNKSKPHQIVPKKMWKRSTPWPISISGAVS